MNKLVERKWRGQDQGLDDVKTWLTGMKKMRGLKESELAQGAEC